jgi:hypothetical protein
MESKIALEEAKLVLVVGDEHVLGLSVGVEHHLVGLTAVSGLLVSTEGSVSGVQVVAVHPHTASLNGTRHLVLYSVRQYRKNASLVHISTQKKKTTHSLPAHEHHE